MPADDSPVDVVPVTQVLAVGGGKGGVGKSCVSANLAIAIAQAGHRTMIADLDLGGANLHTLLGIQVPHVGIGDYAFTPGTGGLDEYAVDTGIENLRLISGNGFIPGIANLEYQRKVKILKAIARLEADYVVLDLGAGTNFNVIDFFTMTGSGIVVSLPEPTAILNAYEFLKNVVFRILGKQFRANAPVMEIIGASKTSGKTTMGNTVDTLAKQIGAIDEAAERALRKTVGAFRPALVLNMVRTDAERLGKSLEDICRAYLSVKLLFFGSVPHDIRMHHAGLKMRPLLLEYPDCDASRRIRQIADTCLRTQWAQSAHVEELPDQLPGDADVEETGEPQESTRTSRLLPLLAGRSDSDLSSLLSGFLHETRSALTGESVVEQQPVAPSEGPVDAVVGPPTAEQFEFAAAGASFNLPLEPRVRPDAKLPYFTPVPEAAEGSGPVRRIMDRFKAGKREEAALIHQLRHICDAPRTRGVHLALKSLAESTPLSAAAGWEWVRTGLALVRAQQIQLAQEAFAQAYRCLPGNDVAANNLAASMMALGLVGRAPEILTDALKVNPRSSFLCFNLGLAYMALRQYREASESFAKVRAMFGGDDFMNVHFLEGYCLYQVPDYTAAELMLRSVVKNEPNDMFAQFNLALSQIHRRMPDEAVATLTHLLGESPDDADAHAARGLAYWQKMAPRQAMLDFTQAIRLAPSNLSFYVARASIAHELGRYDIAIPDLDAISRLLPGRMTLRDLAGRIRREIAPQEPEAPHVASV